MIKLILQRMEFASQYTQGVLLIQEKGKCYKLCHSLEPPKLPFHQHWKKYNRMCVPTGDYQLEVDYDRTFRCFLPFFKVKKFGPIHLKGGRNWVDTSHDIILGDKLSEGCLEYSKKYCMWLAELMMQRSTAENQFFLQITEEKHLCYPIEEKITGFPIQILDRYHLS